MRPTRSLTMLALVIALSASCSTDRPPAREPTARTTPPAVSPAQPVTRLADLPRGGTSGRAWVDDEGLHLDERIIDVPRDLVGVSQGFGMTFLRSRSSRILAIDNDTGDRSVLTESSGGNATGYGPWVTWPAAPTGVGRTTTVELVLVDIAEVGPVRFEADDEQTLPVPCCDGRFRFLGITQFGDVVVDSSAGVWVWGTSEGAEGVEHPPPDSDDYIRQVPRGGAGRVVQVTANDLVVRRGRTYRTEDSPYGNESPGRPGPLTFEHAVFESGAQRVVHWIGDVVEVRHVREGYDTRLDLPRGVRVGQAWWDGQNTVLLDLTDDGGRRGLVTCRSGRGTCRLVTLLDPQARVAR